MSDLRRHPGARRGQTSHDGNRQLRSGQRHQSSRTSTTERQFLQLPQESQRGPMRSCMETFQRRPPRVTVAKWTTRHATEQDMKQGITAKWDAQDAETRLYAPNDRHVITEYEHLIARIKAHMLLTIKKVMETSNKNNPNEILSRGTHGNETLRYKGLPQPRTRPKRTLNKKTATQTTLQATTNVSTSSLQKLFHALEITERRRRSQQGTTWLKLGLLYELRMDAKMLRRRLSVTTHRETSTGKNVNVDQHLDVFKIGLLQSLKSHFSAKYTEKFRTTRNPRPRFKALDFTNGVSNMRTEATVTREESIQIQQHILAMRQFDTSFTSAQDTCKVQKFPLKDDKIRDVRDNP